MSRTVRDDLSRLILYLSSFEPFVNIKKKVGLAPGMDPSFYHTGSYENDKHIFDEFLAIKERFESGEVDSKPLDIQHGGNHYKQFTIQPITFIQENKLSYMQGNVIKYITRYNHKNGLEDLKKAKHYIDMLIDHEYGEL